jgi:hypothetical protein
LDETIKTNPEALRGVRSGVAGGWASGAPPACPIL